MTAMRQLRVGQPVNLPPKTTSFKRWAESLVEYARSEALQYSAPTLDSDEPPGNGANSTTVTGSEPSRNAPCPCGSGKKYKRCHGAPANRA